MSSGQQRHVTQRPTGEWADKAVGSERAGGLYQTQAEAQAAATQHLQNRPGGGQVVIHRPNGDIRNANTINRPDPNPPRDTRH
jgi:hypothetical protein